ncbi:MAG: hypothetical protein HGA49_05445, partial [Eubacteriaceae bacterium]|nr:hypothetical protein [Eubacteriaceae bacterium]
TLEFDDKAKEFIATRGTNLEYGARPLRRTIQKEVEDRLSEELLRGTVSKGTVIKVTAENDELKFNA